MSGSSLTFYKDLPAIAAGQGLWNLSHHTPVPDDWCVVVVDIVASTAAIEAGKYKDVNMVSASAITAVLNAAGRQETPYIFGGDGATILVPVAKVFDVAAALYGARQMAAESFQLTMRAGIVMADELRKRSTPVRVGKMEVAPGVYQASLSGEGVAAAERLVKAPESSAQHDVETLFSPKVLATKPPDFSGLSCRWQPLQSRNGFDISLIVIARHADEAAKGKLYRDILEGIAGICGKEENWKPVSEGQLAMSGNPGRLSAEAKVHTSGKGGAKRLGYLGDILFQVVAARLCMAFGFKAGGFDGRGYKKSLVQNTDYIKFDNALRLVMDVTPEQKEGLAAYLDGLVRQGMIFYGMHAAFAALMTCLVFDYDNAHMHFVDGADGGYALAAKALKQQMKDAVQDKAA